MLHHRFPHIYNGYHENEEKPRKILLRYAIKGKNSYKDIIYGHMVIDEHWDMLPSNNHHYIEKTCYVPLKVVMHCIA